MMLLGPSADVLLESNVGMRTRDSVRLAADIYRPNSPAQFPVLLMRLPYGRDVASTPVYAHPSWYARQGYVVVIQDVRGRGDSEGTFYPGQNEGEDGYDAVEWAASLPMSDSNVGMYGFSYQALAQLLTAALRPPHLRAMAPAMTAGSMYEGWAYRGGCFALAFNLSWAIQLATQEAWRRRSAAHAQALIEASADLGKLLARLPIGDQPVLAQDDIAPYYADWVAHESDDAYWGAWSIRERYADIRVPALHIGGWFDIFDDQPAHNFANLRTANQAAQKLVVGPWAHLPWTRFSAGLDFGPYANSHEINDLQVRWFDRWLKGLNNGIDGEPPISLFATGQDAWRSGQTLEAADRSTLFLSSGGRANSLGGDGRLVEVAPTDEPPDIYVYEPLIPTWLPGPQPLLPVIALGPHDQRPAERFNNVLVYTSPPLEASLEVSGWPMLTLHISSTAADTDFFAKLVDVHPDGFAQLVSLVPLRARFRDSLAEPAPLEPGAVYQLNLTFPLVCHTFRPRHAVRLELASSCFPLFDRNPNTGTATGQTSAVDFCPATQTVLHDAGHASNLTLPI